uniref:FAD-binding protein n=1 Tax=Volvariella volvacea TaxID=36659 RepID=M9Z699_9AGAR|nr:FAD-binding protein [Volvariella volvacea]
MTLKAISRAHPTVSFSIKAGSHIAPAGFNSTTGLLIDMSLFNQVAYNEETTLVEIGSGLLWYPSVCKELKKYGRNVNGATSCTGVGVSGFNLGGGYGNKANQFGLAMDTIKAIEIVLPDGEIKTVSENSDADLFWALKGGGNNFGIVTKWTMETHPQGAVYTNRLNYKKEYFGEMQAAIWAYIQKQVPKSHVEIVFEWSVNPAEKEIDSVIHANIFYDGTVAPADLFKEFTDIEHTSRKEKERCSWFELMESLPNPHDTYIMEWSTEDPGRKTPQGYRGRYACVMLSRYTPALIKRIIELAADVAKGLKYHGGYRFFPVIRPGSPTMFQNSPPSAWPHGPEALFPLPIQCSWKGEENDKYWLNVLETFCENIRQFAIEQGCTKDGVPMYYNLALDGTDVSLIYRENLPRLIDLRARYDKLGVMNRFWQYGNLQWDELYEYVATFIVTAAEWRIFQYNSEGQQRGAECPPSSDIIQPGQYTLLATSGEPACVGLVATHPRSRVPTALNSPTSKPRYWTRVHCRDSKCLISGLKTQTYSRLKVAHIFPRGHEAEWIRKGYHDKITDTADEATMGGPSKIDSIQNMITLRKDLYDAWVNYEFGVNPNNDYRITAFTNGNDDINGLRLHLDHIQDPSLRPLDELFMDHFKQGLLKHTRGVGDEPEWGYEVYDDILCEGSFDMSNTVWETEEGKRHLELALADRLFDHRMTP